MPLSELGAYLQRHREEQDLSLDELEQITRIRRRYLVAIEAGDWDALPPSVYTRGLLRNYARALGLSTNRVLRMYVKERPGEARLPEPQLISRPLIEQPRFNLELLLAVVLMIAAAGLFGWIIMTQLPDMLPQIANTSTEASASAPADTPERLTAEATPGASDDEAGGSGSDRKVAAGESDVDSADDAKATDDASDASDAKDEKATADKDDESRSTPTPKSSDRDSSRASGSDDEDDSASGDAGSGSGDDSDPTGASAGSRATTPARRSTTVAPMPTASRRASPTPDGLVLLVEASSDTWIRVHTDGEEAYASFLYEGDTMTWRATESVRLRTGNAGGTEITINGQTIDKLGDGGSVEEREWRLLPNGDIEQREV